MVQSSLDNKRIRKKLSASPKENCFLACLLKSLLGMVLVSVEIIRTCFCIIMLNNAQSKLIIQPQILVVLSFHFLYTETESENEFRPLDGRIDEFHPKATRTLFIGNLEKTTSYQQLLDIFQRFGEIVVRLCAHFYWLFTFYFIIFLIVCVSFQDIDIKNVNGVPQYAFVQYSDIASVCKAIKKMDGEYLGSNRLKVSF